MYVLIGLLAVVHAGFSHGGRITNDFQVKRHRSGAASDETVVEVYMSFDISDPDEDSSDYETFRARNCTRDSSGRRVYYGSDVSPGRYPYLAQVLIDGYFKCGGAIVSTNFILTEAHCVSSFDPEQCTILVGTVVPEGSDGTRYGVSDFYIHPEYEPDVWNNDIALVRSSSYIYYNHLVQQLPITKFSYHPTGLQTYFAGWGRTEYDYPSVLQEAVVKIIDDYECQSVWGDIMGHNRFCAVLSSGSSTVCYGDSGTPLVYNGYAIGLVNKIYYTCASDVADVFLDLYPYRDWIYSYARYA